MTTPGPIPSPDSHEAITRRAADYSQRRRFWAWSEADQAELDAWLAQSFLHRAAFLRVEGAVKRTERLAALRPRKPDPEPEQAAPTAYRKFLRPRFVLPLLAAASIALIAALAGPFVASLMQPPDRVYSTDVGGRTLLKFADSTEVDLNTQTLARFRMTSKERTVWLEKGEAWFRVAHDTKHPFTVVVGRQRVTDLGTEFFVRRSADGVEVALLNGRAALNTEGAPLAVLVPGDDAVATRAAMSVTHKTPQELADALAWRRGVLVFRNTSLADAAREFNRYNETKLVIADPAVAKMTLGGEFKTDNLDHFLSLAQAVLNLRVDHEGNEILLSRMQRDETKRAARVKRGV